MPAKTIRVPPEVFEGITALRGHADLDPAVDLIECLEYLWRTEAYRATAQWINDNFQDFWDGWDGKFLKEIPDEVTETVDA